MNDRVDTQRHFRCVGIGPANLSLASMPHDHQDVSNVFMEKLPEFGWHDGQQISGATLQVSMLKDLVSLAEPTSSAIAAQAVQLVIPRTLSGSRA